MKLLLHEPDYLEDAQGTRHLVAGLVEVDDEGKLIVSVSEPVTAQGSETAPDSKEQPVVSSQPSAMAG